MPALFELRHLVQPHEIDDQGHVSNVEYLRWLQNAAIAHSAAQGWTKERYLAAGAVFVVRSHQIEYLQPAFVGDEVKVVTWVSSFHKFTTVRKYQVLRERDGLLLAKAATTWAFISWPKRLPKRCPPELVEAFAIVSEDQEPGPPPIQCPETAGDNPQPPAQQFESCREDSAGIRRDKQ